MKIIANAEWIPTEINCVTNAEMLVIGTKEYGWIAQWPTGWSGGYNNITNKYIVCDSNYTAKIALLADLGFQEYDS